MNSTSDRDEDELRPKYDVGALLRDGRQGVYAERFRSGTNLVRLAPDVAGAFPTDDAVNETLRLVIELSKLPHGVQPS